MRNLLLFLWKQRFFIFFIILETIAMGLIVSNNNYQESKFMHATQKVSGSFYELINNSTVYLSLRQNNKALLEENARLRNQLKSSFLILDTNAYIVSDTVYQQRFKYIETEVLKNSFQKRSNYLLISKGKLQGLQPQMGVVTSQGVLGIINKVSDNYSSVISVLHPKSAIDASLGSSNYTGSVSWDGKNYRIGQLENIPSHVEVHEGDSIYTSGNSSLFPKGILIGKVVNVELKEGEGFYHIDLEFSVDYNHIQHAYAILNLMKKEEMQIMEGQEDE